MKHLVQKANFFGRNFISIGRFIVAAVLSLAILGGIIRLAQWFIPNIEATSAALIAFVGTVLTAIIKNYFDRASQIESERRKEKQKNYDELISSIGKFLRDPKTSSDDFSTIHLKSWIYGNEKVVKLTNDLININRTDDLQNFNRKLEDLLRIMRTDIGLLQIDNEFTIGEMFPEEVKKTRGT